MHAPDSFGRRRLGLHGDLLLGPPVAQPNGHRVRHDDHVIRLRRDRISLLVWRGPRGQSLRRDQHRVGGDDASGAVDVAEAGREVDALVLRRGRQDEAAAVLGRPAAVVAAATVFPGERLRLSPASIEREKPIDICSAQSSAKGLFLGCVPTPLGEGESHETYEGPFIRSLYTFLMRGCLKVM